MINTLQVDTRFLGLYLKLMNYVKTEYILLFYFCWGS